MTTTSPSRSAGSDIELAVSGMTCESCAMRIERKLKKLDGVSATVNYATEKARITTSGDLDPQLLITEIENAGYQATLPPSAQTDHDARYDYADEYLDVVYKLLEGSWEDGAVLRDRERGIFSDPQKIHPINHQGNFFTVPGIHLCEPSPQRTPVLYQAGASSRGKQFAAGHAECVFVAAPSKVLLKKTVIVGETDREAQAKWQEYKSYVSYEGALALISGWTGIDFGQYQPDQVLKYLHTNAIQSAVEAFSTADPDRQWTVQALADWVGIGGFGPLIVGSAQTVADELQSWVEETDVDGFNLAYAVTHETFRDVVDLLIPELQKRGVFKQEYREGTLREKLFGAGPRLVAPHPGAGYRRGARIDVAAGEKVT